MVKLVASGVDGTTIFTEMADHLPAIIRLMDEDTLDILREHHSGLDYYATLVEEAAAGLNAALKPSLR